MKWPWRRKELSKSDLRMALNECGLLIATLMQENDRLQELLRGVGANRYWEGRWRDQLAESERLRAELRVARAFERAMDDLCNPLPKPDPEG